MDDELAYRLSALRRSFDLPGTASVINSPPTKNLDHEEDALVARFAKISSRQPTLKSRSTSGEGETLEKTREDGLSLQELMNVLDSKGGKQATERFNDTGIRELLAEAKEIAPWTKPSEAEPSSAGELETGSDWTEDDILRMVKDEIDFEAEYGIKPSKENQEESWRNETASSPKCGVADLDEALLKRFEALGGLELPPVPEMEPGGNPSIKFAVQDETDSWCCICNEDAEYRCSGCENDIYCATCLYEAHTEPNAGYDERRHKWTKYNKPKRVTVF